MSPQTICFFSTSFHIREGTFLIGGGPGYFRIILRKKSWLFYHFLEWIDAKTSDPPPSPLPPTYLNQK